MIEEGEEGGISVYSLTDKRQLRLNFQRLKIDK